VVAPAFPSRPTTPRDAFSRLGRVTRTLTVEQCAYLAILMGAVLTRFWNLGARALHHDESLHAWFSYQYAIGKGYMHDPLMHGPFLFHVNALVYALFGATDASSRYGPAFFGVILVMLPILLRPVIGRWGALICSLLLLVSPSILYYSRLIRHDVYLLTFTFLILVAIARYVQTQEARWVVVGMMALALAHTNHEASYIIAVLLGAFLFIIITWHVAKSLLLATVAYLALAGASLLVLPKLLHYEKLPKIPWDAQAGEMNWAHWRPYLQTLLGHPMIQSFLLVTIVYVGVAAYLLSTIRLRQTEEGTTPNDRLFGGWGHGTVIGAFHRLLADKRVLFGVMGAAFFVWVVLYSSLFTNIGGVFSGAFYSGIYWAGQQDVFRGGQPWYYFFFLFPLSGPVSFLFGLAASALTVGRFVAYLRGKRAMTIRLFTQAMLVWYGVGMFAVLSEAGEKMPWLVCHIILPFTILAASLLGEAVEYVTALWRERATDTVPSFAPGRPAGAFGIVAAAPPVRVASASRIRVSRRLLDCGVIGGVVVLLTGWFFAVSRVSANPAGDIRFLVVALPVILLAFFAAYALQFGVKRSLSVAAIAIVLPLALFEVHLGWHLAFFAGDTPTDMLVYTQTAPDIKRMMTEVNTLSQERTGGYNLPIWYSSSTVWPMNWYLRDYQATGAGHFLGSSLTAPPPDDAAIVMVANEDFGPWEEQNLQNYERTDYVMRWWFPEEIYRSFTYSPAAPRNDYPGLWKPGPNGTAVRPTWGDTLKKAWQSIRTLGDAPQTASKTQIGSTPSPAPASNLWRFVALREPQHTIDSYNFHLYVRKDLVREFNGIRY
jgi:predicted membrane-bound mannosyltransferase